MKRPRNKLPRGINVSNNSITKRGTILWANSNPVPVNREIASRWNRGRFTLRNVVEIRVGEQLPVGDRKFQNLRLCRIKFRGVRKTIVGVLKELGNSNAYTINKYTKIIEKLMESGVRHPKKELLVV